ncbi:MAG: hypothetical protein [Caudoviricetes sp.]|nr:MAG: hypothetical protein [Caudoviricetes sp.]
MKIPTTSIKNIVPFILKRDDNNFDVYMKIILNPKWKGFFNMIKNPYSIKLKINPILKYNDNTFKIIGIIIDDKVPDDFIYNKEILSITFCKSNFIKNKICKSISKIIFTNKKDKTIIKLATKS